MTTESPNDPLLGKYRKLLGLSDTADLAELKRRYAQLHEKFSRQIHSQDEVLVKKGRKNRTLLEQAYTALAGAIRSDGTEKEEPAAGEPRMSLQLCSMRVGFQILEGGGGFSLETKKVDVNLLGMRTVQTNNRLKASWPGGKLVIYNDHFRIGCILGSYEIPFRDISSIDKVWYLPLYVRIRQKSNRSVCTNIFGWGLARKLKELSPRFTPGISLDY